jgi:TolB protein
LEIKRGDDTHIAIIPSQGGEPVQLTFAPGQSWPHSWSPDGDKIVFAGARDGVWNLWWVSRSDKSVRQLTHNTKLNAYFRYPAWSPLANQIVSEYSESRANIYLMELR